jgi:uncharacterized cupredoxin-like copper-binding protein
MVARACARRGRWRHLACGVVAAVAIAGCGGGGGAAGGRTVGVTERDFHIATTADTIGAGAVTLQIHNAGPDEHELIVAPERAGGLPLRADGFTVNEEKIESSEPGSIEPQQPHHTELLNVRLKPGRYVLFCNMEGHYMAGMHTVLVVR